LGELESGPVGETATIRASMEIPIEYRIGAKVRVESPGHNVKLVSYGGHGKEMKFEVRADPAHSGDFPFRIIVESGGRTWEAAGVAKVERPLRSSWESIA
jgi:hypothetical protein